MPTTCAMPGCGQLIERGRFLCAGHWARLPEQIRRGLQQNVDPMQHPSKHDFWTRVYLAEQAVHWLMPDGQKATRTTRLARYKRLAEEEQAKNDAADYVAEYALES